MEPSSHFQPPPQHLLPTPHNTPSTMLIFPLSRLCAYNCTQNEGMCIIHKITGEKTRPWVICGKARCQWQRTYWKTPSKSVSRYRKYSYIASSKEVKWVSIDSIVDCTVNKGTLCSLSRICLYIYIITNKQTNKYTCLHLYICINISVCMCRHFSSPWCQR